MESKEHTVNGMGMVERMARADVECMERQARRTHALVELATEAVRRAMSLAATLVADRDFEDRLEVKKAFNDAGFYLHALELGSRDVPEDEYWSDGFTRECEEYSV